MKQYMNVNLLWLVPATVAIGAFWLVSAKANYEFGLSLGDPIFGYASLASDVTKTVALFGVFAALASGYYGTGAVLTAIWAACTIWSVASAVGFMSLHYATMTDQRGKSAEDYKLISGQLVRFEEQLSKVSAARPEAVVQSEIAGLLRTPGVNGCATIDGPVTKAICPKLDSLMAELGNAKSFAWLTGRVEELRREMKTSDRVTSVDPRAETLAAISGSSIADTKKGIVAFFAILLELVTALGFWAFWRAFAGQSEKPQEAAGASFQRPMSLAGSFADPAYNAVSAAPRTPLKALEKIVGVKSDVPKDITQTGEIAADLSDKSAKSALNSADGTDFDGPGTPAAKPEEPSEEVTEEPTNVIHAAQAFKDANPKAEWKIEKRASENSVTRWLRDRTVGTASGRGQPAHKLLPDYNSYCRQRGEQPLTKRKFSTVLRGELDLPKLRGADGKRKSAVMLFPVELVTAPPKRRAAA